MVSRTMTTVTNRAWPRIGGTFYLLDYKTTRPRGQSQENELAFAILGAASCTSHPPGTHRDQFPAALAADLATTHSRPSPRSRRGFGGWRRGQGGSGGVVGRGLCLGGGGA